MFAAGCNHNPEVISLLLEAGAKIDDRDKGDWTPLMLAAKHTKNPDVISALLKLKSKEGKTAYDYATGNENLEGTQQYLDLKNA